MSSTRLAAMPPAFSTRTLPAQATEYAFAFIQIPQDVSAQNEQAHARAESEICVAAESFKIDFSRYQLLLLIFCQLLKVDFSGKT